MYAYTQSGTVPRFIATRNLICRRCVDANFVPSAQETGGNRRAADERGGAREAGEPGRAHYLYTN